MGQVITLFFHFFIRLLPTTRHPRVIFLADVSFGYKYFEAVIVHKFLFLFCKRIELGQVITGNSKFM